MSIGTFCLTALVGFAYYVGYQRGRHDLRLLKALRKYFREEIRDWDWIDHDWTKKTIEETGNLDVRTISGILAEDGKFR